MAFDVAGGTPDDLDKRPVGAQIAFFIRIEDADERDLIPTTTSTAPVRRSRNTSMRSIASSSEWR
jgi:hypothetical protein